MAAEKRQHERQEAVLAERLSLDGRRSLRVTGVREVLHVEETAVVLQTADGLLTVRGEALTLRQLAPEEGRVELRGKIEALFYGQEPARGGILRRFLG